MTFSKSTQMHRHLETFLSLRETAEDKRFVTPYKKTFAFSGDYIDAQHASLAKKIHSTGMIDIGVEGWLLPADAEKLYELAYFSDGNIFEIGTYRGLSSIVMSSACLAAGKENEIISVDLDPAEIEIARRNLKGRPGTERVSLFAVDGEKAIKDQAAAKTQFGFVFLDHSHAYDHVYAACRVLHRVVSIGGFALFHDYNDPRNVAPAATDYGVYQGVMDGLDSRHWEFWGLYGCTGLFRRIGAW